MKQDDRDSHKYEDIIRLPHPDLKNHPRMSMHDRAAQFSPFAALTGHGDHIRETARLTDGKTEMEEDELALLDERLRYLRERLAEKPQVTVAYFRPDDRKDGGAYLTVTGTVRKIDEYEHRILFDDGTAVDIGEIYDIDVDVT